MKFNQCNIKVRVAFLKYHFSKYTLFLIFNHFFDSIDSIDFQSENANS